MDTSPLNCLAPDDRPAMSSRACAFSIAALVGDEDSGADSDEATLADDNQTADTVISPLGK